jgi:outer membrane lipase/esterase
MMIFRWIPGRTLRDALAGLVLALLVACGGGTSQYDPFVPKRLLAFGDESSALDPQGRRYAVNAVPVSENATTPVDCTALPIWVQQVASLYGFVFAECNPANVATPQARMLATAGAKVADIKVQIDAQTAAGGFAEGDLATMLAGTNDIVELYQQFPGRSEEDLANELRNRGQRLAQEVNRLVDFGVKVIVSSVPDVGVTPYAVKQRLEFGDTDRAALLSRLTAAFNEQLGVNIVLDGRFVALVQGDLRSQAMARSPAFFGLANVTQGACNDTVVVPFCDTGTLVAGAAPGTWMWADDLRPGYPLHQQLGTLAIDRARRNPF